ncbi:trichohyalin-like [Carassius carassius]|uniref:trichohyalin-like n=1 Tax=Carassius carassius TaxID=217509 RepID=UPI002868BEA0|nr:trichohyalin-like [Carassius carassius]
MASGSVDYLRIVLIGKNGSENSRVGNITVGTEAFNREAPFYFQQHSMKISGEVEGRHITVINTHLLQPNLSHQQITQGVRECVSLSAPGPHVFVLVLQYKDFSENDKHRVKCVLNLFSYQAMKHTIVLTTDEEPRTSKLASVIWNNVIHDLIKECGGGNLQFDPTNQGWRSELFRKIENILKKEHKEFLICDMHEDDGSSVDGDLSRSGGSIRGDDKDDSELNDSTQTASDGGVTTTGKTKLNIVLCGYNPTLKNSVSKMFRGITSKSQKEMSKVCVKKEGKIHGRQISVIELPALTRLSEEEVLRETLHCLSLCDPGVHLFILVSPVCPLNNEDRAEMEKIKGILNSNEHFMVLFITELDQSVRDFYHSLYGSWYIVMGLKDQRISEKISDLFDRIDGMKTEPYSLQMHISAPEKRVRHELEEQLRVRDNEVKELQKKIRTLEGVRLNLVVCGSNRELISFISNLILKQSESESRSELSSECVRRDVELDGRLVSLVELPALFNTQLSEEEVMRQTHRCVSLCHPGVHVFILIIPDASFTDEDKSKTERIQRIFSSRVNKHIMILIKQDSDQQTAELNEETQSVIERFGGRHHFIGPNTQASVMMEKLEQMVEENSGDCFSTDTLMETQMEKLQKFEEIKMRMYPLETWFQSQDSRDKEYELRIVLLGKTGVGKSSTGNTILGRKVFEAEAAHESITKVCHRETAEINSRHITVIDTPGLFDTELSNEETQREISNCIPMILPGPHVFIIVLNLGQRFTQEEEKSVEIIQETFGENSLKYTMVLFTRGDDLNDKTIEQYLGKSGSALKQLIDVCENRYHVFNNKETRDRTQVTDLLQKIDNMVKENGGSYYSCKMFREMERELQEQQKNILMEKVEQVIREKEELMNKHEEEKKRTRMKIEEKRQNHEKEKKRREEEFIEREERYKRDIKEREEQEKKIREELKREREEWEKQKQQERQRREEEEDKWRKKEQATWDECNQKIKLVEERMQREKEVFLSKYKEEKERMKMMMDEERRNHEEEIIRREEVDERRRKLEKETWDEYYQKLKRERERRYREKKDLQIKYEEERKRMKKIMEKERQNHDKETKRREEEYINAEDKYKRDIKYIEEQERKIQEDLKRGRKEWEKQKQQERQREEEENEMHKFNELNTEAPEVQHTNNDEDSSCLRILLFGKTGSGKSATGNTILRKDEFHSEASSRLVTTVCQMGVGEVDGQSVSVIDTPGLFDTTLTKEYVQEEIMKCFSLSAPGPHAFIIVLSVGKITPEENDTLDMIKMIFGSKAADFCIVLFTRGDKLRGQTIEQYVEKCKNAELKTLMRDCGNRFLAFNNTETQDQTQVTHLLNMIEEMNEGQYFTNEMFEKGVISTDKRMEMLEENKRKNLFQIEKFIAKYDMEIRNMGERLEEKKQRKDEERERLKNKFRDIEETLRREFEENEQSDQKKQEMIEDQRRSEEEENKQRAEYDQIIEEMKREMENQRIQYEKQIKEREEEVGKREEEYKQDQENMKNDHENIMTMLRKKQEEEIKKRDLEEQMRNEQEVKEREEWKRKIKEAESDKETQEEIKRQQREWEEEKNRQMREREEVERETKERHEKQLREKQEELENKSKEYERERKEGEQIIEKEREKLKREKEQREREYKENINEMERHCEQLERERKEEGRRRKQKYEERRVEKRKRWKKMIEDLKQEHEDEIKKREREETERIVREEKECDEMKQKYEEQIERMKKKHQDEVRKQEKELIQLRKGKEQQVQELKERLEQLYEMKRLRNELKDKWSCHVM